MIRRVSLWFLVVSAGLVALTPLSAQQPPATPPPAGATAPAPPPGARGGGRGAPPIKSPEIAADGRVTFRMRAPNASEVAVVLGPTRLPMQKDAQGVWSATSDVLTPDYYTYAFAVDGTNVNDPVNRQLQTGFGTAQSMFVVPGSQPWLPSPGVPRGAIARHAFHSAVANDDRDFFVYTPPGYEAKRAQAISRALSPARARRRCRTLDERRRGERHPRQPDRAAQGSPDGGRDDARLRRATTDRPARWRPRASPDTPRACSPRSCRRWRRPTTSAGTGRSGRSRGSRWAARKRSTPPSIISTRSPGSARSAAHS